MRMVKLPSLGNSNFWKLFRNENSDSVLVAILNGTVTLKDNFS